MSINKCPKLVNATTEFVDDTDFASDIPTDGPATVEMVNATKDKFDMHWTLSQGTGRTIDEKFPEIAEDTRNLRLGISADGVDVNTGNRHHSVWPVLTVIYNLPPWLCMKRKFINLSGLIRMMLPQKITLIYVAVVLWAINDYPALGTIMWSARTVIKEIIDISSDSSDDRRWAAKKASAPVFYRPSTQGLLDAYGYNTIEEYLSWNYFPSTDNESTDMETIDKRNTDKDCIDHVLGLPNVTTWDEIEKKMGARKSKTCADKAKGKRKVSCGS
ncbi:ribonuclease H-like domain-containing protein [Tanacetum coccineum]